MNTVKLFTYAMCHKTIKTYFPLVSEFSSETIYDNFPIPDTILADPDLHDHDLIDNVMYVYFGPSQPDQPDAGKLIRFKL